MIDSIDVLIQFHKMRKTSKLFSVVVNIYSNHSKITNYKSWLFKPNGMMIYDYWIEFWYFTEKNNFVSRYQRIFYSLFFFIHSNTRYMTCELIDSIEWNEDLWLLNWVLAFCEKNKSGKYQRIFIHCFFLFIQIQVTWNAIM